MPSKFIVFVNEHGKEVVGEAKIDEDENVNLSLTTEDSRAEWIITRHEARSVQSLLEAIKP
ncbi:MAG: hypothetical protein ACTHJR_12330 [Sphingomonas sp.]|uniref:hypothetical protein n=1 Tax=Sphingomonas sp. TaxID=28214 RepID=UPI003F7D54B9